MTASTGPGAALTFGEARVTPVVELIMPTSVRWLLPEHADPRALRDAAAAWLRPRFMNERGHLLQTMQAFVVQADGLTVVVDTGIGNDKERPGAAPEWHRRSGPFLDDFRAAGFDPGAVDLVVCTHMHVDHVGWNTRLIDGAWLPTFANARYIFAQREYDYWQAESGPGRTRRPTLAPDGIPAHGAAFDDSVAPIVAAGRADLVDAEHRLSAVAAADVERGPHAGTHDAGGAIGGRAGAAHRRRHAQPRPVRRPGRTAGAGHARVRARSAGSAAGRSWRTWRTRRP